MRWHIRRYRTVLRAPSSATRSGRAPMYYKLDELRRGYCDWITG